MGVEKRSVLSQRLRINVLTVLRRRGELRLRGVRWERWLLVGQNGVECYGRLGGT